jgi:hypothetical protein
MKYNTNIETVPPSLRERKQIQTRTAIAETAKTMFSNRRFDNVTGRRQVNLRLQADVIK